MSRRFLQRFANWSAFFAAVLLPSFLCCLNSEARVGGGESFSSGDSGGGGAADELLGWIAWQLIRLLFELTFSHPKIGIPIDLAIIALIIWLVRSGAFHSPDPYSSAALSRVRGGPALSAIRAKDKSFSEALFYDFASALYPLIHEARGRGDLELFSLYLLEGSAEALMNRSGSGLRAVEGVVVGASNVIAISGLDSPAFSCDVEFQSTMTEVRQSGTQALFVREVWTFQRQTSADASPRATRSESCPGCGGTLEAGLDGACPHCGKKVVRGEVGWRIKTIAVLESCERPPLLTGTVHEQGSQLPTLVQPNLEAAQREFAAQYPGFNWNDFYQRVEKVFLALQTAWSTMEWEKARALETDSLFQSHRYWMEMYTRENLRNICEDVRVSSVVPARVFIDGPFDSITVRVFASMRDYTINQKKKVVAGSRSKLRRFSEYWTFIRKRGITENRFDAEHCPNCGAALKISMAGICEHCNSKITSGEFDWVLSRIEQDEVYRG